MNKIQINTPRNKQLFYTYNAKLSALTDFTIFHLFDKYLVKELAFISGQNTIIIQFINDTMYVESKPIQYYQQLDSTASTQDLCIYSIITQLYMALCQPKVKVVSPKRKYNGIKGTYSHKPAYLTINNVQYETTNTNKSYKYTIDKFPIRGHIRTLKSGKQIFIKSYIKVVDKV